MAGPDDGDRVIVAAGHQAVADLEAPDPTGHRLDPRRPVAVQGSEVSFERGLYCPGQGRTLVSRQDTDAPSGQEKETSFADS